MKTLVLFSALALSATLAQADFVTFSGSSGSLAASAKFDFDGAGNLIITLTNTASTDATNPSAVLSGVFFNLTGNPTLTPLSAIIPAGSSIVQASNCSTGNCVGATNVGGEWAFNTGIAGKQYAVSANGYINQPLGNFGGADLDEPDAPNGMNFGIVNAGFAAGDGNPGMDDEPFINNAVVLTLSGVGNLTAFNGNNVPNVSGVMFQYGTGLDQPSFPGTPGDRPPTGQVPEPSSVLLLGTMVGAVAHLVWKRRSA